MVAATTMMLNACQNNEDGTDPAYDKVIDVPILGWKAADTLFFPLQITDPTTIRTPILQGIPYTMGYSVRMSADFHYTRVPMQLIIQQTDTTGGCEHIVRNVLRRHIAPAVRDTLGRPLGPSWGSLIDYDGFIDDISIQFDSLGSYRMMLIPDTKDIHGFTGLSAIGLSLSKQY